jgi:hypothetical protein
VRKIGLAEILVLDVCARRLSAAGDRFCALSICPAIRQHAPGFSTVFIVLRIVFFIVFPLFSLFLRWRLFPLPAQGLAL